MSRHPSSLQSFREIREEGLSYADKTEHVHRLLMDGRGFRLTRPRAFGKTLLLSTLRALFRGRGDLFRGLYLGGAGWDFARRPVISLDFSRLAGSAGAAGEDLCWEMKRLALKEGLQVKGASPGPMVSWLVDALYAKHQRRPAVLVDNVSRPLERHLGDPATMRETSRALEGFWEALASQGPRLRFVMALSGYAFSGMTGPEGFLKDASVGPRQAACCGFTSEEMARVFGEPLAEAAELRRADGALPAGAGPDELRSEIFRWYGGYSWDAETRVACPAAVLSFLDTSENSWHFLEERAPDCIPPELFRVAAGSVPPGPDLTYTRGMLQTLDPAHPALGPLMFQAGALTLSGRRERDGVPEYSLGFPDRDAEGGFRMIALSALSGLDHAALRAHIRRFRREAGEGRAEGAAAALSGLLADSWPSLRERPDRRGALYGLLLRLAGFEGPPAGRLEAGGGEPGAAAGWAAGALRVSGNRRVQVILRHVHGADGAGGGAARRLLQEAADAALREAREGEAASEERPVPGQAAPSWEARRLFVFSAGAWETVGCSADSGHPLVFRPLSRAEDG
ncbi:MAG: AAA family ATPase [Deltaproteobacteria bacterium]|jgi:hypothetical protein|nr:AAA family ATPase [Deltaproteobacteria bacterium]